MKGHRGRTAEPRNQRTIQEDCPRGRKMTDHPCHEARPLLSAGLSAPSSGRCHQKATRKDHAPHPTRIRPSSGVVDSTRHGDGRLPPLAHRVGRPRSRCVSPRAREVRSGGWGAVFGGLAGGRCAAGSKARRRGRAADQIAAAASAFGATAFTLGSTARGGREISPAREPSQRLVFLRSSGESCAARGAHHQNPSLRTCGEVTPQVSSSATTSRTMSKRPHT